MKKPAVLRTLALVGLAVACLSPAAQSQEVSRLNGSVLIAFRSVVSSPAKSTVKVTANRRQAALGAVVRADGYIVTKASELSGNLEVLTHAAQRPVPAVIVAKDVYADLALLKIDAQNLPVIEWATVEPPVGSWLATPGLNRDPLAIGVVSVAPRKIRGAALGIELEDSNDVAQIRRVTRGSAAFNAELKVGDIIRQVNGKPVKGHQSLRDAISFFQKGDKVELLIERDGQELKKEATLGSMAQLMLGERAEFQNGLGGTLSTRRESFPLVLQHDTVLNPNQCGGPIVDLDGKAVGINIARAGRVESYALTASVAREAIDKLLAQVAAPPANSNLVDKTAPAGGTQEIQ